MMSTRVFLNTFLVCVFFNFSVFCNSEKTDIENSISLIQKKIDDIQVKIDESHKNYIKIISDLGSVAYFRIEDDLLNYKKSCFVNLDPGKFLIEIKEIYRHSPDKLVVKVAMGNPSCVMYENMEFIITYITSEGTFTFGTSHKCLFKPEEYLIFDIYFPIKEESVLHTLLIRVEDYNFKFRQHILGGKMTVE